ncbi:MAG: hypothetical protein NDJ18_01540 [candidate division Zixibacteria bacterium]|nr:hypothetical protein [candidate division Zixibacteria bacterium]
MLRIDSDGVGSSFEREMFPAVVRNSTTWTSPTSAAIAICHSVLFVYAAAPGAKLLDAAGGELVLDDFVAGDTLKVCLLQKM